MSEDARIRLVRAAHIVAMQGLSDAFGHISLRLSPNQLLITPPRPLSSLGSSDPFEVLTVGTSRLPENAPREAWIHSAITAGRPTIGAVVRAQPRSVAALVASGHPLRPLHGHGAFLGETVPVYEDSRLIRDFASAEEVSHTLGDSPAIILRGNGAVTVADTLEQAVALMWVLEKSAELNLLALGTGGSPTGLSHEEQKWWIERGSELLPRIYHYLDTTLNA